MLTHNGILNAFRWFYNWAVEEASIKQTNADRIHSKSIEELAEFIINNCDNPISDKNEDMCDYCEKYDDWKAECDKESCKKAIANWLQSEVEG